MRRCRGATGRRPAGLACAPVDAFVALFVVAAVAAVADWWAVGTGRRTLEYVAKPATLAALVAAAAVLPAAHTDLVDRRAWFVAALACCLVGDVLLMLPRDLFVPGLAAFLAGHVAYVVGLLQPPAGPGVAPFAFSTSGLVVAGVAVAAAAALPVGAIVRAIHRSGEDALIGPVLAYVAAIGTMAVLALNVGIPAAGIGAACFLVSDTLLALDRFVRPLPRGTLLVHVTYHVAQGLLVLSLLR